VSSVVPSPFAPKRFTSTNPATTYGSLRRPSIACGTESFVAPDWLPGAGRGDEDAGGGAHGSGGGPPSGEGHVGGQADASEVSLGPEDEHPASHEAAVITSPSCSIAFRVFTTCTLPWLAYLVQSKGHARKSRNG